MKPVWILEHDTFQENLIRLKLEIEQQGMECIVLSDESLWKGRDWDSILGDSNEAPCATYYGSLQGAQQILAKTNWVPGVWCDLEKFKCSTYYPPLYKELLNQNHRFLPFGLFKTLKDELYEQFSVDGCIFVRPDTGAKLFTGQIVEHERFDKEVEYLGFYEPKDSDMIVVAEPQKIVEEHRVIVINGKAIAQSLYRPDKYDMGSPSVGEYAEQVAKLYNPQRCFVVDIAVTSEGYRVLELNSFSCSGWYKANLADIVRESSIAAVQEWEELYSEEIS